MKHFIQNISFNRVLLALAVSASAGSAAGAAPTGTVTSTVSTPAVYSNYSAANPVPFVGKIVATPNGVNATADYKYYFIDTNGAKRALGGWSSPANVTNPQISITIDLNSPNGIILPVGRYPSQANIDCVLSAPGRTDVPGNASNPFSVNHKHQHPFHPLRLRKRRGCFRF